MRIRRSLRSVLMTVTAALVLLAAACGDDTAVVNDTTNTSGPGSTSSTATTTSELPPNSTESTSTTIQVTTTTTGSAQSTTTSAASSTTPLPDEDLPGTVFELTPQPGRVLAVIGVQFDDVLNVRRAPGIDHPVVAELAPLAADFVASGRGRMLTSSIWWEVTTVDGIVGWVSASFTAQVGPTKDVTASVVAELGGIPEAETMTALGLLVADALRYDPDVSSEVVLTVEPSGGDLGEVTYDLVGLGDDATRALRLHVFGQPLDSGKGFSLMSVESTEMCHSVRGPSEPAGLCA